MGDISPLITLIRILFVAVIILGMYSIYALFFKDNKTIKSTEKPSVTYEFKAKGQKVDTIWIYKFK